MLRVGLRMWWIVVAATCPSNLLITSNLLIRVYTYVLALDN